MSSLRVGMFGASIMSGYLGYASAAESAGEDAVMITQGVPEELLCVGAMNIDPETGRIKECPPGAELKKLIESQYQGPHPARVELVTLAHAGLFSMELLGMLENFLPRQAPLDVAFVLVGSNDVGTLQDPKATVSHLDKIYRLLFRHSPKVHVFGSTIPKAVSPPDINENRAEVNALLSSLSLGEHSSRFHLVDLFRDLPFEPNGWTYATRHTSTTHSAADGLHFSPRGYRHIGQLYYDALRLAGCLPPVL
jgi:lysophospholipase L1-like esterase